jgi:3'(2'), 5'-bisphosphate nucleotidase
MRGFSVWPGYKPGIAGPVAYWLWAVCIRTWLVWMGQLDYSSKDKLALAFGAIAVGAGQIILKVRALATGVHTKADGSPVTQADLEADRFIRERLSVILPGIRVITEETFEEAGSQNDDAGLEDFVLVDPLDGTREFVAGRDEFTVNVALIKNKQPVVGAIYVPAKSSLYVSSDKAYRADVHSEQAMPQLSTMQELRVSAIPECGLRAVASRSHLDPATKQWLDGQKIASHISAGSSLKFCTIAEGAADVYPRFGPTMEWDTAAGHAILVSAGGCVVDLDGSPLYYGKAGAGFRNSAFVAWGRLPLRQG